VVSSFDRACDRQFDEERAALPGLALHPGATSVGFGNAANDGEAEADPSGLAALSPWLSNTGEFLEQATLILGGNPGSAISHFDAHTAAPIRRPHHDGPAGIRVFDRVGGVVRHAT